MRRTSKVRVNGRVTSQATVVAVGSPARVSASSSGSTSGPRKTRILDGISAQPGEAWAPRRPPRHVRCARGSEAGDRHGAQRRDLAAVPRAFHAKSARDRAEGRARGHCRRRPDDFRAARSRHGDDAAAQGGRWPARPLCTSRRAAQDAAEDICATRHLPIEHPRQLHSPNPLERLNKEIKRRSNVVGIFPTLPSVIRLVGAILLSRTMNGPWPSAATSVRIDEATHGADAARDRTGDLRGDRVTTRIGGALVETGFAVSKQRWTVLFPSTAAAASTPWSNSGKTRANYTT